MKSLVHDDMASVAVLVQAALCALIEGVIAENEEKLSVSSMERSDNARVQYDYLKNSFPAFARKLIIALERRLAEEGGRHARLLQPAEHPLQ